MKSIVLLISTFMASQTIIAQGQYEPSDHYPFGRLNPEAPKEVGDYQSLIGTSDCLSINRNPDLTWQDTVKMEWTFKYIMDGTAVQDASIKSDGGHTTSIRQYDQDSARWHVAFFSRKRPTNNPGVWSGGTEDSGDIVLYRKQKAPNGMDGQSRLTFYNISDDGFDWEGVWISDQGGTVFPFWRIHCRKR